MQRAFALDVLVCPELWGIAARARHRREARCGPPDSDPPCLAYVWTPAGYSTAQCAQYTGQVEIIHGFFELSSTAARGCPTKGCLVDCALARGVGHQKLGKDSTITTAMSSSVAVVAQALRLGDLHRWHVLGRVPSHAGTRCVALA